MPSPESTLRPSAFRRVLAFLGLKKSIFGLLSMVILVGLGEKMAEQYLPLYLLALTGLAELGGFLNGLDNFLSALYSFPGGYLSDRLGIKRALLVFNGLAMFGFLIVVLFPSWIAVFIGSLFFLSWTAISLPATMDLVSKVLPKNKRTMGVSVHSLVRRIPMAIGPVIGGALIDAYGVERGVRMAFGAALVLAAVGAVLQQVLIEDHSPPQDGKGPKAEKNPLRVLAQMSPALRNLLCSDILIRFCEQIPYAYVAIWAMTTPGAALISGKQYGLLRSVEMVVAMLVYIPVAYLADRSGKKPFVAMTFVFFTFFPLVLLFSKTFWLLILAFVLRGLKEFGEPTRKALIMDLAPEGRKAAMFGTYYLVRDSVVSLSAVGGALLWAYVSPAANFLAAFGFGVLGTTWFILRGKDVQARSA
jgi:MFS family permease